MTLAEWSPAPVAPWRGSNFELFFFFPISRAHIIKLINANMLANFKDLILIGSARLAMVGNIF